MKKNKKIFTILIILIIIAISFPISSKAAISITNIKSNRTSGSSDIASVGSYIYTAIANIGIILSVVVVAVLGVKYIMGSADERAEYKKTMMPYLIGVVLVFSASVIVNILIDVWK